MRCGAEFYRHVFEHEVEANHAMLKMLGSVPAEMRGDGRFQRAVDIAGHMVSCRQCFLKFFLEDPSARFEPFGEGVDFAGLEERFGVMEGAWRDYLASLDDTRVDGDFVFPDNGKRWRMSLEAQLFQLVGHAAYHRGQVVLLVDSLGGGTFDTDYIEWFTEHHPEGWGVVQ